MDGFIDIGEDLRNFAIVREYVGDLLDRIENLNLNISVETDLGASVPFTQQIEPTARASATLDPAIHGNMQGFWIKVTYADGTPAACHVSRLFDDCDFIRDWVLTNRIYDGAPAFDWSIASLSSILPAISGRVCFTGGLRVTEAIKRHLIADRVSLASGFSYLSRSLALLSYNIDFGVGFIEAKTTDSGKPARGWSHRSELVRGYYRGRRKPLAVDIHWSSRAEIIAQAERKLGAPCGTISRMAVNIDTTLPARSVAGSSTLR